MDQSSFGKFVSELRREKNMTQEELGARLGVTNKTVSRWENGNYMPDISLLQQLSAELGVNVNEVLSGKRLLDDEVRREADENVLSSLQQKKSIRRMKRISVILCNAGIGLFLSTSYLLWTDSILFYSASLRRVLIIAAGVALCCAGWYGRGKLKGSKAG